MIVVLDTNVIVHAAFRRDVDSDNLVARSVRGEFDIATSRDLLAELSRTLHSGRLSTRFQWQPFEADRYIREFEQRSNVVVPTVTLDVVRDASDNRVLEAGVAAEADFIVSVDKDLLALGTYEDIRILTEAEFVAILRSQRL